MQTRGDFDSLQCFKIFQKKRFVGDLSCVEIKMLNSPGNVQPKENIPSKSIYSHFWGYPVPWYCIYNIHTVITTVQFVRIHTTVSKHFTVWSSDTSVCKIIRVVMGMFKLCKFLTWSDFFVPDVFWKSFGVQALHLEKIADRRASWDVALEQRVRQGWRYLISSCR